MTTQKSLPLSYREFWDAAALKVKRGRGSWVLVVESDDPRRGGRNSKVKENLERRGLSVEVQSRIGNGSKDRPWVGVLTWARTI